MSLNWIWFSQNRAEVQPPVKLRNLKNQFKIKLQDLIKSKSNFHGIWRPSMSYLSIWTVPMLTTVRQKIATSWLISVFLKEFMVTSSTAALQNGVSRKKIIILFVLFLISWSSLSFCSLFKNQIPTSFFSNLSTIRKV